MSHFPAWLLYDSHRGKDTDTLQVGNLSQELKQNVAVTVVAGTTNTITCMVSWKWFVYIVTINQL